MRLKSLVTAVILILTMVVFPGDPPAACGSDSGLDLSTEASIRTSFSKMSSGLSHRGVWELTTAVNVLMNPDLWRFEPQYDEQVTTDEMISSASQTLQNSGERKYWLHRASVVEVFKLLESFKELWRSDQLLAIRNEINALKINIADAPNRQDSDIETTKERIAFLEGVGAELEAL